MISTFESPGTVAPCRARVGLSVEPYLRRDLDTSAYISLDGDRTDCELGSDTVRQLISNIVGFTRRRA